MQLRVPGSSVLSFIIDSMVDIGGKYDAYRDRSDFVDDVEPDLVAAAVDQLGAGHIEYLGLNDPVASLQAADAPGGGYVLERLLGSGSNWVAYPASLPIDDLRAAFLAFLAGDVNAGLSWPEAPVKTEQPKRGWFKRKA